MIERNNRKAVLTYALMQAGLTYRDDSRLCEKYVYQNEGDVQAIVARMSQMKYLFEYQNIREKMNEIYRGGFKTTGPYTLLQEAEKQILEKIGGYPEKFPWLV